MKKRLKLLRYKSVRIAVLFKLIEAFLCVLSSYSLSYIVVSNVDELIKNVSWILLIFFSYAVSMFVSNKSQALSEYYVVQDIKQKTDKWMASLSFEKYHKKDHGEWLSIYVNDVNRVTELTLNKYFSMVENLAVTIFVFLSLFSIHYSMAVIALISLLLMSIVPKFFQKTLSKYILGLQGSKEKYLSKMRELLQAYDTFQENTAFHLFLRKSRRASEDFSKFVLQTQKFTSFMSSCLTLTNSIVTVIALTLLSYNVMLGNVKAGAFLSVSALFPSFGAAVMQFLSEKEFYNSGQKLYDSKFSMVNNENFNEEYFIKAYTEKVQDDEIEYNFEKKTKDINNMKLNSIQLKYDNKTISFPERVEFKSGFKYAIIGESGCGKSTLLRILTGQEKNYSGDYEVNQEILDGDLFDNMSYVNQTTFLLNDTVRNNIDFEGTASQEDLENILKMLNLENISLDQKIVDNGKNLSGGQRQRIAIARALLRKKSIIILDEATANLDKVTANKIENYILEKVDTVIMISHHLTKNIEDKLDKIIRLG
ncbi:ATP-binding cassette domain-containing protein [Floricoccus penangensis]|uniref:ATP-binding cassette domain-containing protein n=1 Tax=Floricoccus penangensis TaxID=1859475 RepID=UPI00203E37B0|nr:ABC transporter ATP-binding protein [Floricoccus penangensis]URZ87365.1 ABC transporter ATP-binding protein/permease [Floricoccus penangensis]